MKGSLDRVHLKNLSLEELEAFTVSLGEKPFRGRQLARWLYGKGARTFREMTNLAKTFREKLEDRAWVSFFVPEEVQVSRDGTQKFRFRLGDGQGIESVLLPEKNHYTLCLSTQVGCALGCKFCLTGRRGFVRNLDPSEIIDQVIAVRALLPEGRQLTNLVLMGMGEPLENFANVIRAVETLRAGDGMGFSHRRVTLSTAGIIPRFENLGARKHFVRLAISLNASHDEQRSQLMPINRKYPLKDLIAACRKIPLDRRENMTFEYVLIKGFNDSLEDARRVAELLKGMKAKVNLIPFNEHPQSPFKRPGEETIKRFQEVLMAKRFSTMIRQSKGADISAACGQLGCRE